MAWIESHQELGRHPKTKRAARLLKTSIPAVMGHLHLLWHWCLDFAQDGDLTKIDRMDIADAVMWDGDENDFIDAMIQAGFLVQNESTLVVNDWYEYGGKLIEKRKAAANRMKKVRDKGKEDESDSPENDGSGASDANVRGTCDEHTENVPGTCAPTVHNSTEQYSTDTSGNTHTPPVAESSSAPPSQFERGQSKFSASEVESVYAAYPRKEAKREALSAIARALERIRKGEDRPPRPESWPPPDPVGWLKERSALYAKAREGENPKYTPHPATWFNQARYSDDEANWNERNRQNATHQRQSNERPTRAEQRSAATDSWLAEINELDAIAAGR